jgi:replication-associated recombination protein RarA
MPTFATMETPGGYLAGEVASALQKEIRRGNEPAALFWATELDLGGFGEYVWKRLRIIASEDVGLADPLAALTVRSLYENWVQARKKKDDRQESWRLFTVHAVCLLARAKKSRMIDHALMATYEGKREHLEIPDYALDRHTAAGRKMGRGNRHFFEVGTHLENEGDVYDPYREAGQAARMKAEPPRQPALDE